MLSLSMMLHTHYVQLGGCSLQSLEELYLHNKTNFHEINMSWIPGQDAPGEEHDRYIFET